jgi:RNA polymerase sigma factor (sigma-70 family)
MTESRPQIDTLLEPLLLETSDDQANDFLMHVITLHAQPVIKGVIRYKLHFSSSDAAQQAEADDIYHDVLLQFIAQLQQFRNSPATHPISDVRGMAAIIAHRTCSRWMRRQFPERHAFKNRLHYLLTRQRGLALWQDDGKQIAGFAAWENRAPITTDRLTHLGQLPELQKHIAALKSGRQQELAQILAVIFNHLSGPVEFDDLVSVLSSLLGVRDQPVETIDNDVDAGAFEIAANEPDQAWHLEKRVFLQRLWDELQELPVNQRAALLLNLKDTSGGACITLFPATGIASLRQIADVLEIPPADFAQLWNELPIEDSRIAELLGLTRQQIINARKSGRERLARRLKGFI